MPHFYIGLATTFHDPALAIVDERGAVLFAEASERALQHKRAYFHPPDDLLRFPALIEEHCGPGARLVVALTWSERIGAPELREPPRGPWPVQALHAMNTSLANASSQAAVNLVLGAALRHHEPARPTTVRRYDHHLTHAATACFTSPFDEGVCVIVDGYGEGATSACFRWERGRLERVSRGDARVAARSESLGVFYSIVCSLAGFDPVAGEEWKVMGLAPYGQRDAELYELLRPIVRVDGIELAPGCSDVDFLRRVERARGVAARLRAREGGAANVAATGQGVFAEVLEELFRNVAARGLSRNLIYGGGCALNSSFNGRILAGGGFDALHVASAPGDDGNALGAALLAHRADHPDAAVQAGALASPYLGSRASSATIERALRMGGLAPACAREQVNERAAELIAGGAVVGCFRGRAEFGPRALGNRSILADPRDAAMKDKLNRAVKMREAFRPFAPAVLDEHGPAWFERYERAPYMERAQRFRDEVRARVPAVVHVDGTGRAQSVIRAMNPALHALIEAFFARTGVPLVLNTSLNIMGRPIVHSVEDALGMFFTTGLDALILEDVLLVKPR